ncbi:MAG: HEAT repeat domain-containing protein, partial [bacterium]
MGYASYIIYADDVAAPDVEGYDRALAGLSLGEKIADCQKFNERADAAGISKMLILYMAGGSEISHEVKRIFSWRNRAEKANFLIAQLQSSDTDIVMSSIDLLGVLKEPFTIPYIDAIFNFSDTRLAERIIDALSEMGENVGVATIMKALRSRNKDLLLLAIKRLSRMVEDVSWKVFRPLLQHDAPEIRNEAAFAICIRKSPQSAACLQKAIWSEQDRATKLGMIKHLGTVPGRRLVRPLLYMIVHDKDQKMRLAASRTLDRLQGLLRPGVIYWLRYTPDPAMRAEALFRLGKLGCEVEAHKEFLRRTLRKSQDLQILQACLQALGNIAERTDVDLLIEFLSRDPFTSYNAAFALTKMLRLEDGDRIISIIRSTRSHTTKQI